ncbi:MAG: hypothetical protein C0483_06890 [Pirellula sp.]|nr:hypothetical protein [Pirellula sp.]
MEYVFIFVWAALGAAISLLHLLFPARARQLHNELRRLRTVWGDPRDVEYSDTTLRLIGVALAVMVVFGVSEFLNR